MSHPGVYRTVSNPLMFNMGRRVGVTGPLQPVLPAPYADEGINLHTRTSLSTNLTTTLGLYAVNGLQGTDPTFFNASRSYRDNNRQPAFGGHATLKHDFFTIGASLAEGNLADDGFPSAHYKLVGGDLTARYEELWRLYFEYAMREDEAGVVPATAITRTDSSSKVKFG